MVCDRASNAIMYFVLSIVYPMYSFVFYMCFLLDFGSHFLQFISSASTGAHHKGKNSKENWLVSLYYNNSAVFQIVVGGAEISTACLYLCGKSPEHVPGPLFLVLTAFLTLIMAFKMFVNVFQWFGAIERLSALDASRKGD